VLYWGGSVEGWDLEHRSKTPRICRQCDGLADTWRGRFDNVHVTLRMCAAEGGGFKKYVQTFLMLSAKATMHFHLPRFYRWTVAQKKKVLTERVVLGTILEAYGRHFSPVDCGLAVQNLLGGWVYVLRGVARQMQREAHEAHGRFGALVLDAHGRELRVAEMLHVHGQERIERLLIILGGPDGIPPAIADTLRCVLEEFTDFPVLRCSLPGGIMHSYYALATLFVLHDQGVLLPFLSYLADQLGGLHRGVRPWPAADAGAAKRGGNAQWPEVPMKATEEHREAAEHLPTLSSTLPPAPARSLAPPRARNALVPRPPSYPPPVPKQSAQAATEPAPVVTPEWPLLGTLKRGGLAEAVPLQSSAPSAAGAIAAHRPLVVPPPGSTACIPAPVVPELLHQQVPEARPGPNMMVPGLPSALASMDAMAVPAHAHSAILQAKPKAKPTALLEMASPADAGAPQALSPPALSTQAAWASESPHAVATPKWRAPPQLA